jgi:hypothetical protein
MGISAPERTFERSRGCWNCKSFENNQLSRQHWSTCRTRDLAHVASTGAITRLGDLELPSGPQGDARVAQIKQMGKLVESGQVGMCMKGARPAALGGPEGDFVHLKFLCDRWDGRDGHSVATAGKPLDKLNEELWDIAEGRAKPK